MTNQQIKLEIIAALAITQGAVEEREEEEAAAVLEHLVNVEFVEELVILELPVQITQTTKRLKINIIFVI